MKNKYWLIIWTGILILLFISVQPAHAANKMYWATGLTGGDDALDGIDGAGLAAGDAAIVVLDSGTNEPVYYVYRLQASSEAESSPDVIVPDTNAGTSAWHLADVIGNVTGTATGLVIDSQAAGDVLYFNGTIWTRLAKSAGKYLKSGDSAVSWDTPSGEGHDEVTLADDATKAILGLSTQALSFDTQTAHYALMGPATGDPAAPTFRALVSADIPNNAADTSGNAFTATGLYVNGANCSAGQYPLGVDDKGAVESCTAAPTAASLHVDDILTSLGIASEATHFGTFTGSTITDNQTAKAAMQLLETAVETKVSSASTATYTEPGSTIPLCRTGAGTIGGCTNVTDVAFSSYAALAGDNTYTGANTIGDGGDDQRLVMRINATNERWSGNTIYFAQCAAALAFGTPVYIQATGKPAGADADAAATMPAIGLIVVASTEADTPCTVLTHGIITDTDWDFTTVGATIYTSETVGSVELDVANISDANDVVQVLGIALHGDTLFVNPSLVTIVLE